MPQSLPLILSAAGVAIEYQLVSTDVVDAYQQDRARKAGEKFRRLGPPSASMEASPMFASRDDQGNSTS